LPACAASFVLAWLGWLASAMHKLVQDLRSPLGA
jgi:hypothetical protein